MNDEVKSFLAKYEPVSVETAVWEGIPLEIKFYLADEQPPLPLVTSVRAIVLREDKVVVVKDGEDSYHVFPGGRREAGETVMDTLERELLEETGWSIANPRYFGFAHFHHTAPKVPDYPYPYPDFFQLCFTAEADKHFPDKQILEKYVLESFLATIPEAKQLNIDGSQKALLDMFGS